MARFRLSTDILSPLNSDISSTDGSRSRSAFSFGSLPGTPVFDSNFASPICSASTKETNIDLICAKNIKECASTFDELTNDIKKQSSLNSDKEEKYKEIYEGLKKSMDDLFGKNSDSPVFLPQSKNKVSKNKDSRSEILPKMNRVDELYNSENLSFIKSNRSPDAKSVSKTTEKKTEKCKKEKSVADKQTKHKSNRNSSISDSVKNTKSKNVAHVRHEAVVTDKKDPLNDEKKNSKITSKNGASSLEVKGASSKILPEKTQEKEVADIKKYNFKCQKKIPVMNNKPIIEHKSVSIEKSIQCAISSEMDCIRRFVLDQNLHRQRDLLKVQEMVKKQKEVTDYLFSVIDELLDTNKKLISKCE